MKISFANISVPKAGAIVVGVLEGRKLTASAEALDKETKGAVMRAIKASSFKGSKNHSLTVMTPAGRIQRIVCVGLGKAKDLDILALQNLGGYILKTLKPHATVAQILIDAVEGCDMKPHEMAAEVGFGARLGSYTSTNIKRRKKVTVKASSKRSNS